MPFCSGWPDAQVELYAQPDLRAEIQRLRDATSRAAALPIPASQRASDASLLRPLAAASQRRGKQQAPRRVPTQIANRSLGYYSQGSAYGAAAVH
jgi:hypothetical protein